MIIRKIVNEDIDNICELHLRSLDKNHFTSTFNSKLLVKYFQKLLRENKYSYLATEENNSSPVAFLIAGYKTNKAINEFIKENIAPVFFTLLRNPQFITEKIFELFRELFSVSKKIELTKLQLYLIEVDPAHRKKGFAKELISNFEKELKKDKVYYYGLSVRKTNVEAIKFYSKSNFEVENTNGTSIHYTKEIL